MVSGSKTLALDASSVVGADTSNRPATHSFAPRPFLFIYMNKQKNAGEAGVLL